MLSQFSVRSEGSADQNMETFGRFTMENYQKRLYSGILARVYHPRGN